MQRAISPMTLGYSILVGPILWFMHFLFVYAISEFGCRANFTNWWYFPPETIRLSILIGTIPVLLLVALGVFLAYGSWRKVNNPQNSIEEGQYFMAVAGILTSGLFLFIIVMTALPAIVLNVCDKAM